MPASQTTSSTLYLVGFRFEPDVFQPQLFTLYVDDDRPIMLNGQPILFVRPERAVDALRMCDCGADAFGPAPSDLYTVFDFTDAVYTIHTKDVSETDQPLNCLNLLLDFANCIQAEMPEEYGSCLRSLADHLTFHTDLRAFFESTRYTRAHTIDAIYWSLGMIVCNVKLLI